jgi:hypothetical protein
MPVVVSGVVELKKALKMYAPDLKREMDATIRQAMKEVTDAAKAKVPGTVPGGLYNWQDNGQEVTGRGSARGFPKYNAGLIRAGLTYSLGTSKTNSRGFQALYSMMNKSPVGAIVETSGRVHPFGRQQKANRKYGQSSKNIGQSNNPDAGRRFVLAMNGVGPLKQYDKFERGRGRLLYAAYSENQGKALDAVMKAINQAATEFQKRATTHNERAVSYGAAA